MDKIIEAYTRYWLSKKFNDQEIEKYYQQYRATVKDYDEATIKEIEEMIEYKYY